MLVLTSSPIFVNGKRENEAFSSLDGNSPSKEILDFQKWANKQPYGANKPNFYPLKEDGKYGKKTDSAFKYLSQRYQMYLEDLMFPKVDTKNTSTPRISDPILIKNPFKTKTGLVTFQRWVLTKDANILGKSGADAKWGRFTSDAWRKYGVEYLELFSPEGEAIDIKLGNDTPVTEVMQVNPKNFPFRYSLSSVGFALGIAYAVNKKTGFWKGFGCAILFSIAGASLGAGVDYLRKPKKP